MKAIIIISGVLIGLILGLYGGIKPKSLWYKLLAIILVAINITATILPPIAGNLADTFYLHQIGRDKPINVLLDLNNFKIEFQEDLNYWILTDKGNNQTVTIKSEVLPEEFTSANKVVILSKYNSELNSNVYIQTQFINPIMTLPYIPDLEERSKILNFHVPMSWIGVLAYLISMIYSILYLKKRDFRYDIKASASAYLGIIFTILATTTGMLWAKFNWGTFWNWDPRETSIFILLLIYFAYFTLRSSIQNQEVKARLSSIYSIIAFITVPFLVFILPRMLSGLHPGSADDSTSGPILSAGSETLNFYKQITFSIALCSFTLIFFWMYNIFVRFKLLRDKYDRISHK